MTALDYILDGLKRELELERELGIRAIACERSLLETGDPAHPVAAPPTPSDSLPQEALPQPSVPPSAPALGRPAAPPERPQVAPEIPVEGRFGVAFLHDGPLSAAGGEMMAKIFAKLELDAATAPIVTAPPAPSARVLVILGARALRRFLPELRGAPGDWLRTAQGASALVTYSPEYILRFKTVTPTVKEIKLEMWSAIKGVVRRLGGA